MATKANRSGNLKTKREAKLEATARKPARRRSEVSPEVLRALEAGEIETGTLVEALVIDFERLVANALPEVPPPSRAALSHEAGLGIVKRMELAGRLAFEALGEGALERLRASRSDTVRGFGPYALAADSRPKLAARLRLTRPFAEDPHFGVREWAWLALRPFAAAELDSAIELLEPWTRAPTESTRRFASELLRPRGVWCAMIPELVEQPERALPLLEPLVADPSRYVQDSVANFLNDAGKSRPDFVRAVTRRWTKEHPGAATTYIVKRATRSL